MGWIAFFHFILTVPFGPSWQYFWLYIIFKKLTCGFTPLENWLLHRSSLNNLISIPGFCGDGSGDPGITCLTSSMCYLWLDNLNFGSFWGTCRTFLTINIQTVPYFAILIGWEFPKSSNPISFLYNSSLLTLFSFLWHFLLLACSHVRRNSVKLSILCLKSFSAKYKIYLLMSSSSHIFMYIYGDEEEEENELESVAFCVLF